MNKNKLLNLIGALIRAADGDLVNKRSCFPCPADEHNYYKSIRDDIHEMYTDASYVNSESFESEIKGKPEKYIAMKSKLYSNPVKRKAVVFEILCHFFTMIEKRMTYEQAINKPFRCGIAVTDDTRWW